MTTAVASQAVPLIYNPAAGGGRGAERFKNCARLFESHNIDVCPVPTHHPGHATELARELASQHARLLVLGGDGTLSEAAEGVLSGGHTPELGFVPAGTGNDFLREFGLTDAERAIACIAAGNVRRIDAARVRYVADGETRTRHAINIIGTGFAAQAAAVTNRRYKWAGAQAYNLGVLHSLTGLRANPTELMLDAERLQGDYPMVMVCNSIFTGNAMRLAPDARPDDGLLDVIVAEGVGRLALLKLLAGVGNGKHVHHPRVQVHKARAIRIAPTTPTPLLIDGEVQGITPVDIDVLPGALRILL